MVQLDSAGLKKHFGLTGEQILDNGLLAWWWPTVDL